VGEILRIGDIGAPPCAAPFKVIVRPEVMTCSVFFFILHLQRPDSQPDLQLHRPPLLMIAVRSVLVLQRLLHSLQFVVVFHAEGFVNNLFYKLYVE